MMTKRLEEATTRMVMDGTSTRLPSEEGILRIAKEQYADQTRDLLTRLMFRRRKNARYKDIFFFKGNPYNMRLWRIKKGYEKAGDDNG